MPSDDLGVYAKSSDGPEPFTTISLDELMTKAGEYAKAAKEYTKNGAVLGGGKDIDKEYTARAEEYLRLIDKLSLDELYIVLGKLATEADEAGAIPGSRNLADLLKE